MLSGMDLLVTSLWFPLILVQIYVLALGFSLLLSAAFVKYRDISYIWEVVLQAFFYITPILYPLQMLPSLEVQKLLMLNPMAQAIQDARHAVVTPETLTVSNIFGSGSYRLIMIGFTLFVLIVGVLYFKKEAKNFAENL
jgi:ABC-2 type transport system permease protein